MLVACSKEEIVDNSGYVGEGKIPMTFSAGIVESRTSLADDNAVHWTDGDLVAIFDGTNKNKFTASDIN